jgi:glutathione S-transferase
MKLYWSPTSPYTRKVRAIIIEKGLSDRFEHVRTNVWSDPAEFFKINPLGKIPAIVLDDGQPLYDSIAICAYLDAHPDGKGAPLYPASGDARWTVMRAEALADGILDGAVGMVVETRKPENERSPFMVARWETQIGRALDRMTPELAGLPDGFTMGHLAFACALGYLDFRHPHIAWREARPELTAWFDAVSPRPCLAETTPRLD